MLPRQPKATPYMSRSLLVVTRHAWTYSNISNSLLVISPCLKQKILMHSFQRNWWSTNSVISLDESILAYILWGIIFSDMGLPHENRGLQDLSF